MVSVRVFLILASVLFISGTVSTTEQQVPDTEPQEQPTEELVVNVTRTNNETMAQIDDQALRNVLLMANGKLSQLPPKDNMSQRRQVLKDALVSELRGLRVVLMSSDCKEKKNTCGEASLRTAQAAVELSKSIMEICSKKKTQIEKIIKKPVQSPDYGVFRLSNVVIVMNGC